MNIGAEFYPFHQTYQERGSTVRENLDEVLSTIVSAGLNLYEPFAPDSDEEAGEIEVLLKKYEVRIETAYVNVRLHEEAIWREQVESAMVKALRAKQLGARIIVTNPEPIQWGGTQDKSDAQLRFQARALAGLGERMNSNGLRLGYHTHDSEMRHGARELHHMLQAVPHETMGFYLDPHWVYRGCGNSALAVEDVVRIYGRRVEALHLRQSINDIWTEHLCDGDIDYKWMATELGKQGFDGPLILETAFEEGTPRALPLDESLRRSAEYTRTVFGL